jgi:hypothetical protein
MLRFHGNIIRLFYLLKLSVRCDSPQQYTRKLCTKKISIFLLVVSPYNIFFI